ncbi:MAG: hypothetical protein IKC83_00630 [Clostridia bacterium]|nr:hypothetical protein [Clostridia bacterium]
MKRILNELERRDLPYTVTEMQNGSVITYAMGYAPFLYGDNQFEIDAFYLTSNKVYSLSKHLSTLSENATPSPNLNYKQIAQDTGLGTKGKNDLIFTEKFGSLCSLGAVYVEGQKENIFLDRPQIPCNVCGKCVQNCPSCALISGFDRPNCLRQQFDSGLNEQNLPVLGKMILGCNRCSVSCPQNKVEPILPPKDLSDFLVADNFFDACIKGRRAMSLLGELIGTNYVRPAKLLTFAVYCINNVVCDRDKWLRLLENYPDKRVQRAVSTMMNFDKK